MDGLPIGHTERDAHARRTDPHADIAALRPKPNDNAPSGPRGRSVPDTEPDADAVRYAHPVADADSDGNAYRAAYSYPNSDSD